MENLELVIIMSEDDDGDDDLLERISLLLTKLII